MVTEVSEQKEEEEDKVYGWDDYNQFQEIEESLPEKGVVLKRLDILDLVLEQAQLESEQHEQLDK